MRHGGYGAEGLGYSHHVSDFPYLNNETDADRKPAFSMQYVRVPTDRSGGITLHSAGVGTFASRFLLE